MGKLRNIHKIISFCIKKTLNNMQRSLVCSPDGNCTVFAPKYRRQRCGEDILDPTFWRRRFGTDTFQRRDSLRRMFWCFMWWRRFLCYLIFKFSWKPLYPVQHVQDEWLFIIIYKHLSYLCIYIHYKFFVYNVLTSPMAAKKYRELLTVNTIGW